jgi:hypothetical protein
MIYHDFDPWAEIARLRLRAAKAAKPAKAGPDFSRISRFSQRVRRCCRCLEFESRGVAVLLCVECGYAARFALRRRRPHSLDARSGPEGSPELAGPTQEVVDD